MRIRLVILTAAAAGLALAGCGGTDESTTASATTASAAATPEAATPSATAVNNEAQGTCTNAQIKSDLTNQPGSAAGQPQRALLALTNSSSTSCVLNGWATVTLTNAAAATVPVPTTTVSQPGAPTPVTLAPGRTAFAGIKWVPCDKGDVTCGVGNSLWVALPGAKAPKAAELIDFPKPEASDITMKSLQIGSIQPSRQGVVAW